MTKNFTSTMPWNDILNILPEANYGYADLEKLAEARLLLLRAIIDLHYNYGYKKDQFSKNCSPLLSLESLKKHSILDFESLKEILKRDFSLNESDIDILCLLKNGFTNRELQTIYNHGNDQSINVRKNRLNQKISRILKEKMMEEKKEKEEKEESIF